MAYVKQNWENMPNKTTPLSAQRMNHLETQYEEAVAESKAYSDVGVASAILHADSVGADAKSYTDSQISLIETDDIDLVSTLTYPQFISHRGAPRVFPEHSREGYLASFESGFSPEADIQPISGGTLVCIHDTTTNRTMNLQKPVASVSQAEWDSSHILPALHPDKITSTGFGTPMTFDEYLDTFGGRVVLFPELKSKAQVDIARTIHAIKSRGLSKSVVVQSFTLSVCQQFVNAGINALMLTTSIPASTLAGAGISFVGVSSGASQSYINSCKSAGLRVFSYTINTSSEAIQQIAKGVDGIFSDDPWEASGKIKSSVDFQSFLNKGNIPPRSEAQLGRFGDASYSGIVSCGNGTLSFKNDNTIRVGQYFKLGSLGAGNTATVRFWVQSTTPPGVANPPNSWLAGVYLGVESGNRPVSEHDNSRFRLLIARRSGVKQGYEKTTYGGSTVNLGAGPTPSSPYASGVEWSVPMLFEATFTESSMSLRNLTLNDTAYTVATGSWTSGDNYVTIGVDSGNSDLWGIAGSVS